MPPNFTWCNFIINALHLASGALGIPNTPTQKYSPSDQGKQQQHPPMMKRMKYPSVNIKWFSSRTTTIMQVLPWMYYEDTILCD